MVINPFYMLYPYNIIVNLAPKLRKNHFYFAINNEYQAVEFLINNKYPISTNVKYGYRSQGNIHLLFRCEDGHFFIKSFDGHKGHVFMDDNILMDELSGFLNYVYKNDEERFLSFDYGLLANIEKFLKTKKID